MNRKQRRKKHRLATRAANHHQQIEHPNPAPTPPRTPEEALRLVKSVQVPIETFLGWIVMLANVPSQFGAMLYVGLTQQLNENVSAVAVCHGVASPP